MNFGKNNGPELPKEFTKDPNEKEPSRRDVLKSLAKGIGVFGALNVAGLTAYHETLKSSENPPQAIDNVNGLSFSQIPDSVKEKLISTCEDSMITLSSVKTDEQIAEINDGRVPEYRRNDLIKLLGFTLGSTLVSLASAPLVANVLDDLEKKGVDIHNISNPVIFSAIFSSLLIQGSGNLKMDESRYIPPSGFKGNRNIYKLKEIFDKELDSGKKITKKDIEDKIDYFIQLRDSLKSSLNLDKKS